MGRRKTHRDVVNALLSSEEKRLRNLIEKFSVDRGERQSTKTEIESRWGLIGGKISYQELIAEAFITTCDRVNGYIGEYFKAIEKRLPNFEDFKSELKERMALNCMDNVDYWMIGLTKKDVKSIPKKYLTDRIDALSSYDVAVRRATNNAGTSIRGSKKSKLGKDLGHSVLRDVFAVLGFKVVNSTKFYDDLDKPVDKRPSMLACLSHTPEGKREADAAFFVNYGKDGFTTIDVTFTGKGNTEQAADKSGRFPNYANVPNHTLVMFPDLGGGGNVRTCAADNHNAKILEFKDENIPSCLAQYMHDKYRFSHDILSVPDKDLDHWTTTRLQRQKKGRKSEPSDGLAHLAVSRPTIVIGDGIPKATQLSFNTILPDDGEEF